MADKKAASKGGISPAVIAIGGAAVALGAAYFLLTKKGQVQGTLTFNHKGLGGKVWAGIGLAPQEGGGNTVMFWESHKEVVTSNSTASVPYTVDFKESLPDTVESGTYDLWAFLHTPIGPIDMDIYMQVKDNLDALGFLATIPSSMWLMSYLVGDIGVLTPGYIIACHYKAAFKYEGGLL